MPADKSTTSLDVKNMGIDGVVGDIAKSIVSTIGNIGMSYIMVAGIMLLLLLLPKHTQSIQRRRSMFKVALVAFIMLAPLILRSLGGASRRGNMLRRRRGGSGGGGRHRQSGNTMDQK